MPKQTFIKLKEEKKKKVEEAIKKEFARVPLERVSISNIVKNAGIPRGSFYQYFYDKEDAVEYIVKLFIQAEYEKVYDILRKTNGDLFKTFIKFYDYKAEEIIKGNNYDLNNHMMIELRKNNINILNYKKEADQEILNLINKDILKVKDDEEVEQIVKILGVISGSLVIEVASKKITIEEGKIEARRIINILKRGMKIYNPEKIKGSDNNV